MSPKNDAATLLSDPAWIPSHLDRPAQALQFAWIPRAQHSAMTFLADEYLRDARPPVAAIPLAQLPAAADEAPAHYIFHSAFCCSTLLARALDLPGVSMALKEPQILNELADAARQQALTRELLATVGSLLARPFGEGERVVIKPSNTVNLLATALMELNPESRAIFLFAPLERFIRSIAAKGMWGRIWARRLFATVRGDTGLDFGLSDAEVFALTDLQASALAWLMQHAQGAALIARFPERVRWLDSEAFLAEKAATLGAAARHFELAMDAGDAEAIAAGPVFTTHSKEIGRAVDPEAPLEAAAPMPIVDEEIAMVAAWARKVAEHVGLAIDLPASAALLPR